jgi:multiple sugar transport system substrate-binding protein
MPVLDRRSLLAGAAATSLAACGDLAGFAKAWAQNAAWKPEPGASLALLRWKRFVPAEDEAFMRLVDAFTQATGVKMTITNESYDDIQPKASVAANTGQGPDMVWGLFSFPALFPDKCLPVDDVAEAVAAKYGPWFPSAEAYGKVKGKWIALPVAFNGGYLNYRVSAMRKAGFDAFPTDTAGFLELCRGLKKNNTPAGFALGHATGDGNSWTHWILWAHGGNLVDKNEKVVINSPETAKALEYVKQLYDTFIPGTAAWNDSNNNKAFLAGELYLTGNGISIYAAAKVDPTKVPNACKAFAAFMLEADNYNPWLEGAQGYLTHPLNAYDNNPVWTSDPKNTVFREASKRTLAAGGEAPITEKVAAALADFVVVDMFASYCTGSTDAKTAMRNAERAAQRIFRA